MNTSIILVSFHFLDLQYFLCSEVEQSRSFIPIFILAFKTNRVRVVLEDQLLQPLLLDSRPLALQWERLGLSIDMYPPHFVGTENETRTSSSYEVRTGTGLGGF